VTNPIQGTESKEPTWEEIMEQADRAATENKPTYIPNLSQTLGEASTESCKRVLLRIQRFSRSPNLGEVVINVAILLQKGATSPKASSSQKNTWGQSTVDIEMIRNACKLESITVRQFARGMKDVVANKMLLLGPYAAKGNLSRKASLDIENITLEEEIWASDFQTYNPNCPERVKKWLSNNYEMRFGRE